MFAHDVGAGEAWKRDPKGQEAVALWIATHMDEYINGLGHLFKQLTPEERMELFESVKNMPPDQ